jgi:hypothetical protein
MDSSGSRYGPVVVSCENDTELSGSIDDRKFPDKLSNYQILKKD